MTRRLEKRPPDFIRQIISKERQEGVTASVRTRFPPEPNGYLHIGHAKAICLNFDVAKEFGGSCHLRFDDTNPVREDRHYVEAIKKDIRWLGYDWGDRLYYASDYFEMFYKWALELVDKGLAYVDELSSEEVRYYRGSPTEPGRNSPYRDRPREENRALLEKMRQGQCPEGSHLLRAKIDMTHPNVHMRDPILYRIRFTTHHRTQKKWCLYPMYDFAHGYEDAIEGITHSLCSLEFENHRPLYNWLLEHVSVPSHPRQIEFARLNLSHTVMSKRILRQLVEEKIVSGWDDPRMPTLAGMRRRGVTPTAIRRFIGESGIAKANSLIDIEFLHFVLREELNETAPRRMVVFDPIKVVIENYPEGEEEVFLGENLPGDANAGERALPFTRELYIEREDFEEDPPKRYFRLAPGREVRLKYAYYITCRRVVKDQAGRVIELVCTYDPASRGGGTADGRKVRGTLHWVEASKALKGEVRFFDHLFLLHNMGETEEGKSCLDYLNPSSFRALSTCLFEPSFCDAQSGDRFQFLRHGYFCADSQDHNTPTKLVFNKTVALKDSWKKIQTKGEGAG